MRSLRSVVDVWPVGLAVARLNMTPLILFIIIEMLFAGAIYRLGGGVATVVGLWLAGAYSASIVLVAAFRTVASGGHDYGMLALGASGVLHRTAGWILLAAIVGLAAGFGGLVALYGPPVFEEAEGAKAVGALRRGIAAYLSAIGPAPTAAAFTIGFLCAGAALGRLVVASATRGVSETALQPASAGAPSAGAEQIEPARPAPPAAARPGALVKIGALVIGAGPLAFAALWLDLARPSAFVDGGYWTWSHAYGETAVFAAAGLALIFAAVALGERLGPHERPNPS